MSETIARKLETWAIDMIRTRTALPVTLQIVRQDSDARADKTRIVCIAETGEREGGGPNPWSISLEVRLLVGELDSAKLETYWHEIQQVFHTWPYVASLGAFRYLAESGNEEESKTISNDFRSRSRTYQFHSLEIE